MIAEWLAEMVGLLFGGDRDRLPIRPIGPRPADPPRDAAEVVTRAAPSHSGSGP